MLWCISAAGRRAARSRGRWQDEDDDPSGAEPAAIAVATDGAGATDEKGADEEDGGELQDKGDEEEEEEAEVEEPVRAARAQCAAVVHLLSAQEGPVDEAVVDSDDEEGCVVRGPLPCGASLLLTWASRSGDELMEEG